MKMTQGGVSDQLLVSAQKVFIGGDVWFQLPEPDPFQIFYVAEGLAQQVLVIRVFLYTRIIFFLLLQPENLRYQMLHHDVEDLSAMLHHCQLQPMRMSERLISDIDLPGSQDTVCQSHSQTVVGWTS